MTASEPEDVFMTKLQNDEGPHGRGPWGIRKQARLGHALA